MGTNDASGVEQPTEAEYERIQQQIDEWISSTTSRRRTLHIHECQHVGRETTGKLSPHSPYAFPYGHRPICSYCLIDLRSGDIDGVSL